MFEALDVVPESELRGRWEKCRRMLAETAPGAGGLLVFSRIGVYYLAGTMAQGAFWLPLDGEPLLLVRRGMGRSALESPSVRRVAYKSYKDFAPLCAGAGVPIPEAVGAEMNGLSWQLGLMLADRLNGTRIVSGDQALALAMSLKSEWELDILRQCGRLHHEALHDRLPALIRPGMTEREISHRTWEVFFSMGHMGLMRMNANGEEIFLGHVSAGDSGNYPSAFNGPLGLRGEHPAAMCMGSAGKRWERGEPLACDVGFTLRGYVTDKTQVYWGGPQASVTPEAAAAHSFCMDVQAMAAESLRPGAIPSEIWGRAVAMAERAGMAEGFMGLNGNKVPFLGHGIGLAVDGYPALARGFDRPLEAGMVLALEPKQGVRGLGMVGVENTFEVTEAGGVCITGDRYDMVCVE
jgi:Xaa-Pro aminopeptidase